MRKTNDTHASKASLEVRELKDELSDAELNTVSGGRKAGAEPLEFIKITMTDVLVSS